MARFNPISQIASLFQLPGATKKRKESEAQLAAVQARVAQQPKPAQPVAPIAPTTPVASPAPAESPAPVVPSVAPDVFAKTEVIKKGLEETQAGLKTLQEKQTGGEDLRKAEEEVLAAQKVSPEEEETEKTLSNLLASKELGVAAVRERPIPLEFITGQQAAIERRAATQAGPLQARLSQLQSKRQAAIDIAKTRGEISKARFERTKVSEEKVDEYTNQEGKRVVVFRDKVTGKVREEVLGQTQPKEATQTEKDRELRKQVLQRAEPVLESSRGQDGFVDPKIYSNLRSQFAQTFGSVNLFDDLFLLRLSPEERKKLEGGKKGSSGGIDFDEL